MKKTIIVFLALAGVVPAATTTVTDLSTSQIIENVTYTAPDAVGGEGKFTGAGISGLYNSEPHTALTFTLNLTELAKLNTQTKLVTVDTDYDLGLYWGQYNNKWGIMGNWNGSTWSNNGGCFVSYDTLKGDAWSVSDNETDIFITLTMTVAKVNTTQGGEQLYKAGSNTSYFTGSTGLGTDSNNNISAIKFNTGFIENAAVTSGWVDGNSASTLGTNLENTYTQAHGGKIDAIPEPTTATLSLLALAGLAARRRRK